MSVTPWPTNLGPAAGPNERKPRTRSRKQEGQETQEGPSREFPRAERFRATLLLRTIRIRSQQLGGFSGMVACTQTNKKKTRQPTCDYPKLPTYLGSRIQSLGIGFGFFWVVTGKMTVSGNPPPPPTRPPTCARFYKPRTSRAMIAGLVLRAASKPVHGFGEEEAPLPLPWPPL